MQITKKPLGNKEVMPFTIPSGIITTEVSCLERIANKVPEVGILTTKSICPKPRLVPEGDEVHNRDPKKQYGNREPIFGQYHPGCFVNAVGLTNPGAEEFAKKLKGIKIPQDKFLLVSIFGKNAKEFAYVADIVKNRADGLELNLSCPHAKGYGMQLGQDPEIVSQITKEVKKVTKKPVFAKLTPNAGNIGDIAKAAIESGAYGITAINTVGPGYYVVDGQPVLTNKVGGLSGRVISPVGLRCVRDIRAKLSNTPIIGMGGIATAKDIEDYTSVGASFFGIGSALAGMSEKEIKEYFPAIVTDLKEGSNTAESLLKKVDMEYKKVIIDKKIDAGCDFKLIKTASSFEKAYAGQFVFAWIPGVGEKPFSIMDNDPLTLGILEKGEFTKAINSLQEKDSFYIRGPYGKSVPRPMNEHITLVGGGCGIAGLYLIAKELSKKNTVKTFLAAKDKEHIPYLNEFKKYGEVFIATENGSLGKKGLVTDLFEPNFHNNQYFFNCGPKAMINAVLALELEITSPERVYSSVDYMTRCGVGICGSCADEKGRRTCVEGPFMNQ